MSLRIHTIVATLLCITFASCQFLNRIANPVVINDKSTSALEYKELFDVSYDPRISLPILNKTLEIGYNEWDQLKQGFFPSSTSRIGIVVYKNKQSYTKHVGTNPPSLAKYDIKTNRIYITTQTTTKAWRHELVHALLANTRLAPYRIQEGLAYYLQHQKFSKSICHTLAKPPEFTAALQSLRRQKPPTLHEFFFNRFQKQNALAFAARSAFYMHFLWQKKMLQKSILYYTNNPSSYFEYELTKGDHIRLKKLYREFNKWLRSPSASRTSKGC